MREGTDFVAKADLGIVEFNVAGAKDKFISLARDDRLRYLLDPRAIHYDLFWNAVEREDVKFVGEVRGQGVFGNNEETYFGFRRDLEFHKTKMLLRASEVDHGMELYRQTVGVLFSLDLDEASFMIILTRVSVLFLNIHPFVDGNGHVFRFIAWALAEANRCYISDRWTIGRRPYDDSITVAIVSYHKSPFFLHGLLCSFFGATAEHLDRGVKF